MPIVLTGNQSTWRDSYASSPEVGLTLRVNGEEDATIFDGVSGFVPAGLEAPTVAATLAAGTAGGTLVNGRFIGYRYVYAATTKYPLVENAVAAGGNVSPRSNPSPVSAVFTVTATGKCIVTYTGTGRGDVSKVWIYRTVECTTSAEATTRLAAGDCYFLVSQANPGGSVTATYIDTGAVVLVEQLEIDNEMAPIFQYTVYDGKYWWGFGNNPFSGPVTLANSSTITLTSGTWFDGRDGQPITFAGITSGGADGLGTFYFKRLTATTAALYTERALTTLLAVAYSGTTTATIKGYSTTLYRSKIRNPFSWGWTELLTGDVRVPQTWALKVGGGKGSAIALIPNDLLLKLDLEEPARCYTLNLQSPDSPATIGETMQVVDDRYSVGSHFSQFAATTQTGQTALLGVDAKNFAILQSDSQSQGPITSGELMATLRGLQQTGRSANFYHGCYDAHTELNCWWVKTLSDSDSGNLGRTHYIDTLIWNHAPTGLWGRMFDFDISASATIYDSTSKEYITLVGTESGKVCRAFDPTTYTNFISSDSTAVIGPQFSSPVWSYITTCTVGASLDGTYIIYGYGGGSSTLGIWFNVNSSATTIPAAAAACTTSFRVDVLSTDTAAQVAAKVVAVFVTYTAFGVFDLGDGKYGHATVATNSGAVPAQTYSAPFTVLSFTKRFTVAGAGNQLFPTTTMAAAAGTWCLTIGSDGRPTGWFRLAWGYSVLGAGWVIPDRSVSYNGTVMYTDAATIPSFTQVAFGGILCSARTYFDLNSTTTPKRNLEMWMSSQNVGATTATGSALNNTALGFGQRVSFYKEFETATPSATFELKRDFLPGSQTANSVNWLTKILIPSTKLNQFGIEIFEVGQNSWRPMSIVLKFENG